MTRNILCWLEHSADLYPDAVAFEDRNGVLTYRRLLRRAKAIGSYLAGRCPAQSPVVLLAEKSPDTAAAMLGCVYAGCFYTPMDPSMPLPRAQRILQRLSPSCILYDDAGASLCSQLDTSSCYLPDADPEIQETLLRDRAAEHIDTDLLYVLFTSGSTGEPKGVAITHRSVIDFVEWAVSALKIPRGSCFGNQAPLYFDNSVLDIYCSLYTGSRVFFLSRSDFLFPRKLLESLRTHMVDTVFWVPSALTNVASSGILQEQAPCLKRIFFCGEVMPCKTLNAWRTAVPDADFVNMYGPTEITDVCTWYRVDRDFADSDVLPIGRPCSNTRIHLIDGEICVAGTCLAAGYYNDPEKTAAVFVPNPLRPAVPETIYRTGDLGTYNERGELLFLGRRDHQIKRSGYRIELGEIECALSVIPGVDENCCIYLPDVQKIVCAYAGTGAEKQIRNALRSALPKYMLPDIYLRMDELPKTGNGKIDRVRIRQVADIGNPIP